MLKLAWTSAALLLASAGAAPAAAQQVEDRCRDDDGVDRCAAEQQRRVRQLFGMRSIEEHRDAGDQVRRVFYVDGYGRDVLAIAFVRSPGREPTLFVHFPQEEGERRPEPLTAPAPLAVWSDVLGRSQHFDREMVPTRPPTGEVSICMHSWVYTVEATDPSAGRNLPATIRGRTEDACADGLAGEYALELQRAALPLLPHCALLDPDHHRNPASQLAACRMLGGDRMAAAEVLNRLDAFRRGRGPEDVEELDTVFAHEAVVDWNGERSTDHEAQRFWAAKMGESQANLFYRAVEGLSATRVRSTGILVRNANSGEGEARYEQAPVEMIWLFGPTQEFEVQSATVGRWQRRR